MKRFFQFLMLLATMVLSLYSCADDDSFSDSPSHFLTFSEDSVRLDTVFSRVPTATKTFWAYNKSGDGIRCQSVRLEKGNQTGYRVNVDGTYLGSSAGYQVSDIEIRNKDSIRVFVELTSPAN
ncbi:MAG: right-handed parallel beta-helix repeat-containing protein, partial [Prevotella sp.]|nr:right-handed parallel beta-helix repeat-containing protein [Prevotella sp.]